MTKQQVTPELIRHALQFIDARMPRDEWAKVAMAIKSEFSDAVELATGFKKSTLYGWIKEGKFPKPIQIGRASVWPESSVLQWVQDCIQEAQQ